jgi:hypothetical protein
MLTTTLTTLPAWSQRDGDRSPGNDKCRNLFGARSSLGISIHVRHHGFTNTIGLNCSQPETRTSPNLPHDRSTRCDPSIALASLRFPTLRPELIT